MLKFVHGVLIKNDTKIICKNSVVYNTVLWKTMPGRLKQVPQDSMKWDRTDTGHCTDGQSNTCDINIDSSSEPSSNKL